MKRTPRAVALASGKGGVGRSTLASALAVQAMKEGARVIILDHEAQGSVTLWHMQRGKPDNPDVSNEAADPVATTKALKAGGWDWVILDTAPAGMDQIERSIAAADFVLVPVRASFFDLAAVREVVAICNEQRKPFAFVLNAVNPDRARLNATALPYLKALGPVLDEQVQDRTAYVSTVIKGLTGPEAADKRQAKPAQEEIGMLWAAVKKLASKVKV